MTMSTQHKGTSGELYVFYELARRGAELYTPVVDIGNDAIVRGRSGEYLELQVKSTEAEVQDRYFNFKWKPQPRRFFICVSLKDNPPTVWVLPWDVFKHYALESGGNWRLSLPARVSGDTSGKSREELVEEYRANNNERAWLPLLPPEVPLP